jgi:hypothetical protein
MVSLLIFASVALALATTPIPPAVPLYMTTLSTSYIFASLGTPPQDVFVQMDSGSSFFAVARGPTASCTCMVNPQCVSSATCSASNVRQTGCAVGVGDTSQCICAGSQLACPQTTPNACGAPCPASLFNVNSLSNINNCFFGSYSPAQSSTQALYNLVNGTCCASGPPCSSVETYGDNSGWQGTLYTDKWTLGTSGQSAAVQFASINAMLNSDVGFLHGVRAGIVGLAYPAMAQIVASTLAQDLNCSYLQSSTCSSFVPTPLTTLTASLGLPPMVSMCFNNAILASGVSQSYPGIATFGGLPQGMNDAQFQWATVISRSYYVVNVVAVEFGSAQGGTTQYTNTAVLNSNQAIIDTGTEFFEIPAALHQAVCAPATPVACSSDNDCVLSVHMQAYGSNAGATISVPVITAPLALYTCVTNKCTCTPALTSSNQLIFGYAGLVGLTVVFDQQHNRVGFSTQAACTPTCDLYSSQMTCNAAQGCMWANGGMCVSNPSKASSSSSFNATAFLVAVPVLLGLAFGASFAIYSCLRQRTEAAAAFAAHYSTLQNTP